MDERLKIKDLSEEDRPREKLLNKGTQSLSNAELLAILLNSGNRNETAVELARKILNSVSNDLNKLGRLTINELCKKFNGIGPAKAITLIAALEIGRRRETARTLPIEKILGSRDMYYLFKPLLADLKYEEGWIALLNTQNHVIKKMQISKGGLGSTIIDIRLIMKEAVDVLASSIVLCHNHPSGNIAPSKNDNMLTEKLAYASKLMDIQLLDHIIIGNNQYYSYSDEGQL